MTKLAKIDKLLCQLLILDCQTRFFISSGGPRFMPANSIGHAILLLAELRRRADATPEEFAESTTRLIAGEWGDNQSSLLWGKKDCIDRYRLAEIDADRKVDLADDITRVLNQLQSMTATVGCIVSVPYPLPSCIADTIALLAALLAELKFKNACDNERNVESPRNVCSIFDIGRHGMLKHEIKFATLDELRWAMYVTDPTTYEVVTNGDGTFSVVDAAVPPPDATNCSLRDVADKWQDIDHLREAIVQQADVLKTASTDHRQIRKAAADMLLLCQAVIERTKYGGTVEELLLKRLEHFKATANEPTMAPDPRQKR